MATDSGGPTTLPGTLSTVPTTFTGSTPRSTMVIVSTGGLTTFLVTPFSCVILGSFEDPGSCPQPGARTKPHARQNPQQSVLHKAFIVARPRQGSVSLACNIAP